MFVSLESPLVQPRDQVLIQVGILGCDAKQKEIKAFFSTVGKVEKIQMVFCLKTHQFLKKAYVYFGNVESVLLVSI